VTLRSALHLALEVDEAASPGEVRRVVRAAEEAGLTLVTFADAPVPAPGRPGRLEAGTRAAFVATSTARIGLAPTLHATTTEPFHLATQLAALDHASHGRAAWVVGAANTAAELATIGAVPLRAAELHRELRDVVGVARALWDSWEDDSVIRDAASGRYLDADKVHHVDFVGPRFTVKGPLITPRPPQGQVVVLAAAELDIADVVDVVLVEDAAHAAAHRDRGAPLVFVELPIALGAPDAAAALVATLAGLPPAVDGVRLHPRALGVDLPVLAAEVVPALRSAGLLRGPAAGATLREALGLPRPANRFATSGSAS
jgi:luciferase-like monooxygenase